jgi:antitoxin MazE
MTSTIEKWGHTLALRIPLILARAAHLENGSVVDVFVRGGAVVIRSVRVPRYELDDLLKRVSKKNIHRSVKTGPAVGREIW